MTTEITRAFDIDARLLPMTEDRVATMVTLAAGTEVGFQDYFVGLRHDVPISAVRFDGVDQAHPAPGVLDAITSADTVVVAPSNPIVSIGPVVAVPGISDALAARRDDVVAVSPIVAGSALKGPAERMLRELGHEPTVVGVARLYRDIAATLVVDDADAAQADAVEVEGMECVVTPTVMTDIRVATDLCRTILSSTL